MADSKEENCAAAINGLQAAFGGRLERDASLAAYSTYRVGGSAAALLAVQSVADLVAVAEVVRRHDLSILVIGNGSNLLVADAGFPGLVLHLGEPFASIRPLLESNTLVAGGAGLLPVAARQTTKAGLSGFEWAVGVPGSVGGAVRMNAGGHGSDVAASLLRVSLFDLLTGELSVIDAAELGLSYRHSNIAATQLVLEATFQLEAGEVAAGEQELSEIVRWRREHQPGGANGGSVFANPDGYSAGALIDEAGCKGLRVGSAEVSQKHANFIMSSSGGSADDVFDLMVEVHRRVQHDTGISLRPENRLIGFDLSRFVEPNSNPGTCGG